MPTGRNSEGESAEVRGVNWHGVVRALPGAGMGRVEARRRER